jgi:crotonobetainyl-CoA:carnitine CoA-transferase CaiB-like acyl-CoA transferase
MAVDLKDDRGRGLLRELVAGADVFLQNYRPGVAERLGVDYATIRAINPGIVYVSMSGYGETGPYARRPGQDLLLQAMGGALYSSGTDGAPPQAAPYFLVDAITAYSAFEGVLAALLHRERTGEGQLVQVNMLDALIADLSVLAGVLRAPELDRWDADKDGFAHRDEISALITERLRTQPTDHWLAALGERGIWAGPVYSYDDLLADPQVKHNGSFVSYDHPTEGTVTTPGFAFTMSATPPEVSRPAPTTGQHTAEILADAGVPAGRIQELLEAGVLK